MVIRILEVLLRRQSHDPVPFVDQKFGKEVAAQENPYISAGCETEQIASWRSYSIELFP
jgi:hypothetical protein